MTNFMDTPQIPVPDSRIHEAIRAVLEPVKESIDIREGRRGSAEAAFVTKRDLQNPEYLIDTAVAQAVGGTGSGEIPPAPRNLRADRVLGSTPDYIDPLRMKLTWDNPADISLVNYVEIWLALPPEGETATVADAKLVRTVRPSGAGETQVEYWSVDTWMFDHHFWVRNISYGNVPSDWEPTIYNTLGLNKVPRDPNFESVVDNLMYLLRGDLADSPSYQGILGLSAELSDHGQYIIDTQSAIVNNNLTDMATAMTQVGKVGGLESAVASLQTTVQGTAWESGTTYQEFDVVRHNNKLWTCVWDGGTQEEPVGVTWQSGTTYTLGNYVQHNDKLWSVTVASTTEEPSAVSTDWQEETMYWKLLDSIYDQVSALGVEVDAINNEITSFVKVTDIENDNVTALNTWLTLKKDTIQGYATETFNTQMDLTFTGTTIDAALSGQSEDLNELISKLYGTKDGNPATLSDLVGDMSGFSGGSLEAVATSVVDAWGAIEITAINSKFGNYLLTEDISAIQLSTLTDDIGLSGTQNAVDTLVGSDVGKSVALITKDTVTQQAFYNSYVDDIIGPRLNSNVSWQNNLVTMITGTGGALNEMSTAVNTMYGDGSTTGPLWNVVNDFNTLTNGLDSIEGIPGVGGYLAVVEQRLVDQSSRIDQNKDAIELSVTTVATDVASLLTTDGTDVNNTMVSYFETAISEGRIEITDTAITNAVQNYTYQGVGQAAGYTLDDLLAMDPSISPIQSAITKLSLLDDAVEYTIQLDNNGYVSGFGMWNGVDYDGNAYSETTFITDKFQLVEPQRAPIPWSSGMNHEMVGKIVYDIFDASGQAVTTVYYLTESMSVGASFDRPYLHPDKWLNFGTLSTFNSIRTVHRPFTVGKLTDPDTDVHTWGVGVDGNFVVDGTIFGNKIAAGSIETRHLHADDLTALKAEIVSIAAEEITVEQLSASAITSGTLTLSAGMAINSLNSKLRITGDTLSVYDNDDMLRVKIGLL